MKKNNVKNLVLGSVVFCSAVMVIRLCSRKKMIEVDKNEHNEKNVKPRVYYKIGNFVREKGKLKCKSINETK